MRSHLKLRCGECTHEADLHPSLTQYRLTQTFGFRLADGATMNHIKIAIYECVISYAS